MTVASWLHRELERVAIDSRLGRAVDYAESYRLDDDRVAHHASKHRADRHQQRQQRVQHVRLRKPRPVSRNKSFLVSLFVLMITMARDQGLWRAPDAGLAHRRTDANQPVRRALSDNTHCEVRNAAPAADRQCVREERRRKFEVPGNGADDAKDCLDGRVGAQVKLDEAP